MKNVLNLTHKNKKACKNNYVSTDFIKISATALALIIKFFSRIYIATFESRKLLVLTPFAYINYAKLHVTI